MTIDVFIIGGYLGSGKSSLVNHLLQTSNKSESGVIVNDLAPVNVDADYVVQEAGARVGIQDGCACCTVTDRLGEAFDQLIAFQPRLRRIFVEASGVGDPYRISYYARGVSQLKLRAMITVVDASNIVARLNDKFVGSLVRQQIMAADALILNKIDMATSDRLLGLETLLREINESAGVVRSFRGQVDASVLLPLDFNDRVEAGPAPRPPMVCDEPSSVDQFQTIVIRTKAPLALSQIRQALDEIAPHAERIKGVVVTSIDRRERHLVQGAAGVVDILDETSSAEYDESVLVFILRSASKSASKGQKLIDMHFSSELWRTNKLFAN